jgi:hypothetical protein
MASLVTCLQKIGKKLINSSRHVLANIVVTYSLSEEDSTGPLALAVSEDVPFVVVGISAILILRIRI